MAGTFVDAELLAGALAMRLGKLTCNTSICDSPNRPDFCVDVDSPLLVVPPVRLLVELAPVEVVPDDPEVDAVPVLVPVPVEVLVPVVDEVFAELLPVVLFDDVLLLDVLEFPELSGVLRKTTERRSISIRRKIARASCERSISTWPVIE